MTISEDDIHAVAPIAEVEVDRIRLVLDRCEQVGEAAGHSPSKILADVVVLLDYFLETRPAGRIGHELAEAYRGKSPSLVAGRARGALEEQAVLQIEIQAYLENRRAVA